MQRLTMAGGDLFEGGTSDKQPSSTKLNVNNTKNNIDNTKRERERERSDDPRQLGASGSGAIWRLEKRWRSAMQGGASGDRQRDDGRWK